MTRMYEITIEGSKHYVAASSRTAAVAKISRRFPSADMAVKCCGKVED